VGSGLLLAGETTEWWHLYLSFGVVTAAGISMAGWVPSILIVRGWFPDRVGTAIGVASAGIGIGMSGLVPLTQLLIDWLGWRWAYRILGAAIAGWVLPATLWLIRDPPTGGPGAALGARATRQPVEAEVYWTIASAVRDRRYWALAGVFFWGNFVTQMLLVHQVAYMVDRGVPVMIAASVGGGVVGVASIVGKIGWGALSDHIGRELAYTMGLGCVVASIGALALVGVYPVSAFPYLYGVLIGVGYASTAPLTPAAASDLFSGPGFSTIFGTLQGILSLGAAVSAWGAGKIFDVTGSYAVALWVALGSAILAPTFMWMAAPRRPHPPPSRH
jgi:MFS family permease